MLNHLKILFENNIFACKVAIFKTYQELRWVWQDIYFSQFVRRRITLTATPAISVGKGTTVSKMNEWMNGCGRFRAFQTKPNHTWPSHQTYGPTRPTWHTWNTWREGNWQFWQCLKKYKLEKILNFLQGLCINLSALQTIGKYFKYKQRTSDAKWEQNLPSPSRGVSFAKDLSVLKCWHWRCKTHCV